MAAGPENTAISFRFILADYRNYGMLVRAGMGALDVVFHMEEYRNVASRSCIHEYSLWFYVRNASGGVSHVA